MISYVIDDDYTIIGDEHKGIYSFSLIQAGESIASVSFEAIASEPVDTIDLSEDAFESDDELSILLAISPVDEVWRVFDLKTAPKFRSPAEFLLTSMQMITKQNEAYQGAKTNVVAFVRDFGELDSVWADLGSYAEAFVFTSKNIVALV